MSNLFTRSYILILLDDGTGTNVYVIDTGINYSHNDLEGRADFFYDPIGGSDPPVSTRVYT